MAPARSRWRGDGRGDERAGRWRSEETESQVVEVGEGGGRRPWGGGGGDKTVGRGRLDEGRGLGLGVGADLSPYSPDFSKILGPRSYTS